jgi:hypothetical protein
VCPAAASTFEWVQAFAATVAALAALGTLVFLWLTVRGAQTLRRAEDRAHLLDLATDYVAAGERVWRDMAAARDARLAGHRFRAAIDATGEPLPACRALLAIEWEPLSMGDAEQRQEEADKALTAALDEIVTWLRD